MEPPTLPSDAAFISLVERVPVSLLAPLLASTGRLNETLRGRDRDDIALAQSIMDSVGKAAAKLAFALELFRQLRPTKAGTIGVLLTTETPIAGLAQRTGLREAVRLSNGERSAQNQETAVVKAAQRLCALVYLTAGLPPLMDLVRPECTATRNSERGGLDAKTALMGLSQRAFQLMPVYKLVGSHGPDHAHEFTSEVRVGSHSAIGKSSSKRGSEQSAAAKLLAHFQRRLGEGLGPRIKTQEDGYFKLANHEIPAMHLRLLPALEQVLSYKFKEPRWLSIALTHASGRNEARNGDRLLGQEPLSLLGGYILALHAYECVAGVPVLWRDELINHARRVAMVTNEQALARIAKDLELQRALVRGRGLASPEPDSVLSNAIQACVAACVLDNGYQLSFITEPTPFGLVRAALRVEGTIDAVIESDPKTLAQQILQAIGLTPQYNVTVEPPQHAPRYWASLQLADRTQVFSIDGESASSKSDAEAKPARFFVQVARECHVARGGSRELRALQAFVLRNLVQALSRDATGWRALARAHLLGAHTLHAGTPCEVMRMLHETHRSVHERDLHMLWPMLAGAFRRIDRSSAQALTSAMRELVQRLNAAIEAWNPTESRVRAADIEVVRELSDVIAIAGRFAEGLAVVPFIAIVDDLATLKLKRLSLYVVPPDVTITDRTMIVCPGLTEELLAGWSRQHFRDVRAEADIKWRALDEHVELSVVLRDGAAFSSHEATAASQLIETILEFIGCHVQQSASGLQISIPCIRGPVHEDVRELVLAICGIDDSGSELLREFAKRCHDLKNVLVAIDNRRELADSEPGKRYHHLAAVEGLHASAKAELARVTTLLKQRITIVWERFDLRQLLQHFVADLASRLPSDVKARFNIDLAESIVDGDPRLIESALANLCKNSLEAMTGGGVLTIEAVREDSAARVTVRDTGGGIPDEAVAALGQGRSLTSQKRGGSGVGLLAVQGIARAHGGSFEIRSGGGGTSATLELRCNAVPEPLPAASAGTKISVTTGVS